MAQRVVAAIEEAGLMGGAAQFMQDRENLRWINARFQGNHAAFRGWWAETRSLYESRNFQEPPTQTDAEPEPLASGIIEDSEQASTRSVEPSSSDLDLEDTERIDPVVEPEKVVTKPSAKRRPKLDFANPVPLTPRAEPGAADPLDPDELIRQIKQFDQVLKEGEQPERQPIPREPNQQQGRVDR